MRSSSLNHALRRSAPAFALFLGFVGLGPDAARAQVALADQPLFTNISVPGNLSLALSVEFPTAVSVAHIAAYTSASTYLGYFDPNKCYLYNYDAVEANRYFYPAGAAVNRVCTGADDAKWSGNFLNWATMQTIDPFRWALTGGYRVVDTPTTTVIEKAWASGQGGTANFPNRTLANAAAIAAATPFAVAGFNMRIQGLGNKMRFTVSGNVDNAPTAWQSAINPLNANTTYEVSVRVKVCDPTPAAGPLETNCKAYANGNYKPEGLLQGYSDRIRYSAFGYLNDGNIKRDGGVLRARQKFIGPLTPVPGGLPAVNAVREWDADTGVFTLNPDAADAANTAAAFGVAVANSGVMNYLNKFGSFAGSYKTYDPVSELYYAAVRYFKNLGNVAAWTSMAGASAATKTTWIDGFPVITDWDDPILWSCQRNFILGIGDVNTHADKNLPGATPNGNEPPKPPEVSADLTVDAVVATNKVGALEGLGAALGTVNPYNGCCNNNSALMAGLAYDSNTRDIRPDDPAKPNTQGKQTIQTYWLDVLEYSTYKNTNQYYLAAKYGGFKVPAGYDPYGNAAPLPQAWWHTNADMIGNPPQPRPDNYFVASRPDDMVAGLTAAFSSIASALKAYTTSFSTALPQVTLAGNRSYAAQYDAETWTGELVANSLSFDPDTGTPTENTQWAFTAKLAAQLAGNGWDNQRRVVTFNDATGAGVPFRLASLSAAQQAALDTPYRAGNDAGDYVNYLRGQQLHEVGSPDPLSARAYRNRDKLFGDVVGARVLPVGPPTLILGESANPGYTAFKTSYAARPNMVYVGANDGMLHAINGETGGAVSDGREVFAYVPSFVITGPTPGVDGLAALGNPNFVHHHYVNATPTVSDVDFGKTVGGAGTDWRTILVGGLGKGGMGYYALDITDPGSIATEAVAASKVLWEFSDPDLGYSYGEPLIVKTKRFGWVVIFASGYNNPDGQGYFFVVNPRTGTLLEKIGTGVGSPVQSAGLAYLNAYVLDRTDGTADAVYAGDLLGNLWRLDVTSPNAAYPAPTLLARLTDANGNGQPVTSRPMIELSPSTGQRWVVVGTGRLLDTTDIASTAAQSFWAIKDGSASRFNSAARLPAGVSFPIKRADMLPNNDPLVGVTFNQPDQMGWYLDLGAGNGNIGWRVTTDAASFLGSVSFAATLPSGDACSPSGTSRIYALGLDGGASVLVSDVVPGNAAPPVIAYSSAIVGVVTNLRFFSVAGTARLIAGSDTGVLKAIPGKYGVSSIMRRLNWRELPTAD